MGWVQNIGASNFAHQFIVLRLIDFCREFFFRVMTFQISRYLGSDKGTDKLND